ncbi:hypothetical protein QE152_g23196 [Popillia japonica]|uniref:DUF4817 domain-containing protein n=1 Tax=Popillia japonica TaxID=7064 RepID=A0AAW1KJH3_POPJA
MKYLTGTHRIKILMLCMGYGDKCRSQVEVTNLFNQKYPQLPNIFLMLCMGYGDKCRSQVEVTNLFNQKYPQLPNISQGTVPKIHAQFRELGHVKPLKRKPHFVDDDVKVNILLRVAENPMSSSRQIARQNNVSHTTVIRSLHNEKLHPYKLTFLQELTLKTIQIIELISAN